MSKRSLILYASRTGHTEKVALRFKQVFEKYGWECDMLKIDKNTDVTASPSPFDCEKYDFLCVGSYVDKSLPSEKVIDIMRSMKDEFGTTFIFSTHDSKLVGEVEIIYTLEDGLILDRKVQKAGEGN